MLCTIVTVLLSAIASPVDAFEFGSRSHGIRDREMQFVKDSEACYNEHLRGKDGQARADARPSFEKCMTHAKESNGYTSFPVTKEPQTQQPRRQLKQVFVLGFAFAELVEAAVAASEGAVALLEAGEAGEALLTAAEADEAVAAVDEAVEVSNVKSTSWSHRRTRVLK